MELWIRSQDDECIMKVNRLDVDGKKVCANGFSINLGEYKSYERALKVLAEIQEAIKESNKYIYDDNGYIKNIAHKTIVYKMPKE